MDETQILEDALSGKEPENTHEEINQSVENTIIEPINNESEIKEQETLSIFDSIKKPTEEDSNIKDKPFIESLASSASSDSDEMEMLMEGNSDKQLARIKADIWIELSDLGFMLLCAFMTWDFSDINQQRFSLNKDRKKAIAENLYRIFLAQKIKANPKRDIIILIVGSYVPMLIVAVMVLIKNMKAKTELKKNGGRLALSTNQTYSQPAQNFNAPMHQQQFPPNANAFKTEPAIGKVVAQENGFVEPQKGRGVVAGQKRGSYKKKG